MNVFALIDGYLPGFRYGGPVLSLANLVARMPDEYSFWIFTRNRDRGDSTPYQDVRSNAWNDVGRAHVYYASPEHERASRIVDLVNEVRPDILYLNSFFARNSIRALAARRCGMIRVPVVIAPRGEAASAALALKAWRKRSWIRVAQVTGLLRGVTWQASTGAEREDILTAFGRRAEVVVAPDLVSISMDRIRAAPRPRKRRGEARFVFLSRIAPMKNLARAIELLSATRGDVALDVYGPVDDESYWRGCLAVAERAPKNVRIQYVGPVKPSEVPTTFARYHFFVLPTLGENFGHVILESLVGGCPVVLSDRTQWRVEEGGAGWTIDLADGESWARVLQRCVDMDADEHARMVTAACEAASKVMDDREALQRSCELFARTASVGTPATLGRAAGPS